MKVYVCVYVCIRVAMQKWKKEFITVNIISIAKKKKCSEEKNSDNQAENRTRNTHTHAISSAKNTEKL